MIEYWLNFAYLALVLIAFAQYRRLVLAAHDIGYATYGLALIEALILAKAIMIGSLFRLGRRFERMPLIYSTLYKTFVFSVLAGVLAVLERVIVGLWRGEGLREGLAGHFGKGFHELLAGLLVMVVALIPFFAVKELGRVLGGERIGALFFRSRTAEAVQQLDQQQTVRQ
jgi:hypothetical protein